MPPRRPPKKKPKRKRKSAARAPREVQVIEAEIVEEPTALAVANPRTLAKLSSEERGRRLMAFVLGTLSPNTQKAYAQDLKHFGKWWGTPTPVMDLIAFEEVGDARMLVLDYKAEMMGAGLSSATIGRRLRALNSIIKKLHFAGQVPWKLDVPVAKVEALKDVRGPGMVKWRKLIQAVEKDKRWIGLRDLSMIRLMGNDNLRAGEIGKLRYDQDLRLDEDNDIVEIYVRGKGGKNVWHPLHPKSRAALEEWLEVREQLLEERDVPPGQVQAMFISARYRELKGKRVWERIVLRAEEAGIGKLHPHALRHHAITQKSKVWKGPQTDLVTWARHSDSNMTQHYIDEAKAGVRKISQLGDED